MVGFSMQPYGIQSMLKEGHRHLSGLDEAVLKNIDACKQLSTITRTSLGPNGMNKMVINHLDKLFVTNDAATIVNELEVQHPAAKLLVLAGKAQQEEIGDGANLTVSFAGELLQNAEELIRMGLHPSEIIVGYTKAINKAIEALEELVEKGSENMNVRDKDEVISRMRSSVASKQYGQEDTLCPLIAEACIQVCPKNPANFNVDNVRVAKLLGGGLHNSLVVRGMVLKSDAGGTIKRIENAKVAVFAGGVDTTATETKGTVLIHSAEQLENYAKTEEAKVEELIKAVADSGAKVIVSGSAVGEMALHFCAKPIIVILMGLPGSGKSTFCEEVMRISRRPWARVCQDTINSGKAGTKIQCLSAAASALKDGKSVLIDRCNIDREQRADFLKLGGPETEKHVVVLDLPAKLCISRSVKRSGHEGNLQGGRAAAVVNHMVPKKELPKLSEGLKRITFCRDEKDVKEAINVYGSLGPLDSLPSGCFGQKSSESKVQVGIMKFLKKVDTSRNAGSEPKDSGVRGTKMGSHTSGDALEKAEKGDEVGTITSTSGATAADSIPTLAFPSISTADFQFNLEKASDIIVEKVEEFIGRIGKARLVLVDLSRGSKILSLVKTKAAKKNLDSDKFFTFVGDITQLRSQGGLHCNVIANAANWRLKPGGGGVNAAIFKAAGSELETATKERAATLTPGKSVLVPLPSSSPLFAREGVTHVIHVLGPNMNPQRPDCLKDDYTQGCKILRQAYSSLFEGFVSTVRSHSVVSEHNSGRSSESGDLQEAILNNEDQNGKREAVYKPENNKKSKGSRQDLKPGVNNQNPVEKGNTTKTWGKWAQALRDIAMHPDNHKNIVLEVSDDVVVINDGYPKAQQHLLVIGRADGLGSIADICREHISLLKKIHDVGLKWAEKFIHENKSLSFRLGYHSVPSMRQLHLHVISQDFDSSHLKNKKHWNSFTTPFFLDSVDVIKELEQVGNVTLKNDKCLAMELRCHRCRSVHPNIPRLKSHISSCKAPFPASLLENGRLISSEGNST